ncbi:Sporulation related protein [Paraglaciecola sp. T6c]|uniref:SPOR domain-containing protein n=1 Tax=Pseudoalteromonas atlantica (strain T6c / ATCC BAA-1087) TaxID=3042615 RepID=UPI00005C64EC|nr:SPOR domain-containing protein [Paraglaciecola sp. T6c]ABG40129.1 Sporulation related protein [Paraglaciecola sp. T6c]
MTSALKNRLIGTVIIVAIAVIFLPDLLGGKTQSEKELFVELPERPAVKTVQRPGSFSTEDVASLTSRDIEIVEDNAIDDNTSGNAAVQESDIKGQEDADVAAQLANTAPVQNSEPQTKPVTVSSTHAYEKALLEGAGWVVQLGTFRHKKNVQELLEKLEKAGYRAFTRPVQTSSGKLTKVFVGPDLQKTRLEKSLGELTELTKLKGRITPFTVQ